MTRDEFGFSWAFRTRYSEVDQQGVVFNAHYLTYFDTAIYEYFKWLPYDYLEEGRKTGVDFHTVKTVVEYKAPLVFDRAYDVGVRTSRLGSSSMTLSLAIFDQVEGDLCSTGEVVWVNTHQATHKPRPIDDALVRILKAREGARLQTRG